MAIVRDLFSGSAAATLLSRLMLVTGIAPVLAPSIGGLVLGGDDVARRVRRARRRRVRARRGWPSSACARRCPSSAAVRRARERSCATYRGLLRDRTFVALVLDQRPGVRDAVLLHLRLVVRPAERLRTVLGRLRRRLRGRTRPAWSSPRRSTRSWSPVRPPPGAARRHRAGARGLRRAAGRCASAAPAASPMLLVPLWFVVASVGLHHAQHAGAGADPARRVRRHRGGHARCGAVRHRRGGGTAGRRLRRRQRRADGRGHDRRHAARAGSGVLGAHRRPATAPIASAEPVLTLPA